MINDDVEERLREALRMHAAEAPPGAALLSTVTTESVRRGRRARLATLSTAAAVLVAIGAAIPFALQGTPAPQAAAGGAPATPIASPTSSTTAAPATPATVALVESTVPTSVTFPFSPPAVSGYGKPTVMLTAGRATLMQQLGPAGKGTATMTEYHTRPPSPTSKARPASATVGKKPATVYEWRWSDDDPTNPYTDLQRTLVWQPDSTTWLTLDITPARTAADLVTYAEKVVAGGEKAQSPFAFKLMPSGWTVDNISPASVTFCPPGVAPDPSYVNKIAVMLDESPGTEPKGGGQATQVQINDRKAWLTSSDEGQTLLIPVAGGRSLLLQIAARALLPTDVLLRFAASITVTPAAQVSQG
ncbi:hypothetical protein [Dactylosporangium darangshiense]|uniref:Uncharacterized protein n=1 Tax=Dactylosporangium darangshiense TaxID=579108 RepID=A0ABP8D532_9ACTN